MQRHIKFLVLHEAGLSNKTLFPILKSLTPSQQSIKYLDLTGNNLGGSGFRPLLSVMPRDLEILLIQNNQLRNRDLRALSQTIRVTKLLDISQNKELSQGASKTFPLIYIKGLKTVHINNDLEKETNVDLPSKKCKVRFKKWMFRFGVRFRFHEVVIEKIENEFCFSFLLTLMMLLSFFFFIGIVIAFPVALQDDLICENGHLWEAHGSFAVFVMMLTLLEALALCSIKKRLRQVPHLFPLSKWSVVWKLMTGVLARADLYTDICFLTLV